MAITGRSVADVMTTHPVVLDSGASLEAADLMLRSTFIKGIPVVDGQGKLVGTITHADLAAHRFAVVDPTRADTGSAVNGRTD
jgi:CBS domain-containing protein